MRIEHIIGRVRNKETAFALMKALSEEYRPDIYKCEFSYGPIEGEEWIGIRATPWKHDHHLDYDMTKGMIHLVRGFVAGRKSMVE